MKPTCRQWAVVIAWPLFLSSSTLACSSHALISAATLEGLSSEVDGLDFSHHAYGIQVDLVPPEVTTTCSAAVGIGDSTTVLPETLDIIDLQIAVVDTLTNDVNVLPQFNFVRNHDSTQAFTDGSGSTGDPETNPVNPGARWFGFASPVDPFSPPILGRGQALQLQFVLQVAVADLPLQLPVQFAAGEGTPDGLPSFTGAHPVQYFAPADNVLNVAIGLLPGDANNDLLVSGLDLIAVQQNFGQADPNLPTNGLFPGDANDDGLVSGLDLIEVQRNFGKSLAAPVPEPVMLASLLTSCLLVRR